MGNLAILFTRVSRALHCPRDYPDFGRLSFRQVFAYLAIVLAMTSAVAMIRPMLTYSHMVDHVTVFVRAEIPDFLFKNGQLEVFAPMPIMWEDTENRGLMVVDTAQSPDLEWLRDYREGVLLGKTQLVYKSSNGRTQIQDLSRLKTVVVSKDTAVEWLPRLKWIIPLLLILEWAKEVVVNLLVALLLGGVSTLFNYQGYEFAERYKMGLYALTLPNLLHALLSLCGLAVPLFSLLYFVAGIIYIGLALQTKRPTVEQPPPLLSPQLFSMMDNEQSDSK